MRESNKERVREEVRKRERESACVCECECTRGKSLRAEPPTKLSILDQYLTSTRLTEIRKRLRPIL